MEKSQASCIVCDEPDARLCHECKSVSYCSGECQRIDWPLHKFLCTEYAVCNASAQPSRRNCRAFFFPEDANKPKVVWLPCRWLKDEDGKYQHPEVASFLGSDTAKLSRSIQYNSVLKRDLADTIHVAFWDSSLGDEAKPNRSIAAITATEDGDHHEWRGPVIAYGMKGPAAEQTVCRDLDMNDFRHIADFFLTYIGDHIQISFEPIVKHVAVHGVRINCIGDQKECHRPHFEAITVPSNDFIFHDHDTSDIAACVGIPIFTQRRPPDRRWAKSPAPDRFDNPDATFLHLCCDPRAGPDPRSGQIGWGWASQLWQSEVGSVTVVRQDQKPLSPLHVEALCRYARHEVYPLFAHCLDERAPGAWIITEAILGSISRATFLHSWYTLLETKTRQEIADVPHPYDDDGNE